MCSADRPAARPLHALGHPADEVARAGDVLLAAVHDDLHVGLAAGVEVEPPHEAVAGVALVAAVGVLERLGTAVDDDHVVLLGAQPLDADVDRVLDRDVLAVDLLDPHHVGVVGRARLLPFPLVAGVGVGAPPDGRGEGDLELAGADLLRGHRDVGLERGVGRIGGGWLRCLDRHLRGLRWHRGGDARPDRAVAALCGRGVAAPDTDRQERDQCCRPPPLHGAIMTAGRVVWSREPPGAAGAARAHHREMGSRWALRAGRAFDGARFLPDGATVVIEGDRVVGVEAAAFRPPDDVPVTDVDGTLLPGLVDCHVHLVASGAFPGTPGSLEWAGTAASAAAAAACWSTADGRARGCRGWWLPVHRSRSRSGTAGSSAVTSTRTTPPRWTAQWRSGRSAASTSSR